MNDIQIKGDNAPEKPLTPAMEDYLEAIFNLGKEKRVVRVKNIAKRLGVKMPTVTSMLKSLSKRGLIDYEKYEYLELTEKGAVAAGEVDRKHHVLRKFLTDILKIDHEKADKEACRMEHAVTGHTLDRFVDFMDFLQFCPRAGSRWLEYFDEYLRQGGDRKKCLARMEEFTDQLKDVIEIDKDKARGI